MEIRKPVRATRTFTQKLAATPDRVFPLLCPVLEADWLEGWDPLVVFTNSGVAEPGCVFMTKATPHPAIWFVTRHEPERGLVEMLKISPVQASPSEQSRAAPGAQAPPAQRSTPLQNTRSSQSRSPEQRPIAAQRPHPLVTPEPGLVPAGKTRGAPAFYRGRAGRLPASGILAASLGE